MCGIAGLICFDPSCNSADHESRVSEMCRVQTHRGPDDSGVVDLGAACLGSRRLSIIDLRPAGHMPMSDETGRWWITYNGEVYNFQELRVELESLGHHFRSRTDTEVVLHAFMEWRHACAERLIGMFAFAVYNRERNELTLVRDRFGIKPLYHMRAGQHLLFSSEAKALASVGNDLAFDRHSLIEWLLYRNIDALRPATLIENIKAVLPGESIEIRNGRITSRCLYSPASQVSADAFERYRRMTPDDVVDDIDDTLNVATKQRLVSDVPVGTLLSGGLDSSLITAIAAKYRSDLTAFNVSIAGFPQLDEKRFADQLTRRLGLRLVSYELTGEAFRKELPRAIYHSDWPLTHPNSIAYYLISRVARDNGVIVLLSGEGADELFGGYSWSYRRRSVLLHLHPLLRSAPAAVRRVLTLFAYYMAGLPATSWRIRELLPATIDVVDCFARADWLRECEAAYSFVRSSHDQAILGSMLADLTDFLGPLLRRLDRMSMAASVECRVPYLDHRLVHKAINLPLSYRMGRRADKWILKRVALRYVSPRLVHRRKMGFPLPLDDYVSPLAKVDFFEKGFCTGVLGLSEAGIKRFLEARRKALTAIFGLVSLEIWGRMYLLGEPIEQVTTRIAEFEPSRRNGPVVACPM